MTKLQEYCLSLLAVSMNKHIILLLITLGLLFANHAVAARMNDLTEFYNRWSHLTEQQLIDKGNDYLTHNQPDSAVLSYTIIINRYYDQPLSEETASNYVRALSNLGYLYNDFYYDYQKAYNYLQTAEETSLKYHAVKQLPYVYLNMGVVLMTYDDLYKRKTNSKETLEYFNKAFHSAVKQQEWRAVIFTFNDLVNIYEHNGNLKSLLPIVRKMTKLRIPPHTSLFQFTILRCQAVEAWMSGQTNKALNLFNKAEQAVNPQELNRERLLIMIRYDKAKLMLDLGKHNEALAYIQQIEKQAEKNKLRNDLVSIYETLYNIYSEANETAQADHYQLKYLKAKEKLTHTSHLGDVSKIRFLNKLRKANEQVLKEAQKHRMLRTVVWIVSIMLTLIAVSMVLLIISYRHQRRYMRVLYQKNMQLLKAAEEATAEETTAKIAKAEVATGQERYQKSLLTESDKVKLLTAIRQIIEDKQYLCNPSFSLQMLCEQVESNSSYVSQVINEKYGRSFKTWLNERRVNEACRRLSDPEHFGQFTIEAVSASVGFKSRANFAVVFKKITGLTPTEFQHAASNDVKSNKDAIPNEDEQLEEKSDAYN